MKKLTLLFLIIISVKTYSQTKNFIDVPYIETSAIADTLVLPNRIHLNIVISEKDTKDKYSPLALVCPHSLALDCIECLLKLKEKS